MTVADEEGHGLSGLLTAYMCYGSKKYSDKVHDSELLIESLQEFARNMDEAACGDGLQVLRDRRRWKECRHRGEEHPVLSTTTELDCS